MLEGEGTRTQMGDKGFAGREGGRQARSSRRDCWLRSSVRLKVMGCVISLTSSVCSATDHVVESGSNSSSQSKSESPLQTYIVSLGLSCQSRPAAAA